MKKIHYIGLILFLFCLCCRWFPAVADFYARVCYPAVSTVLSLLVHARLISAGTLPHVPVHQGELDFSLSHIVSVRFGLSTKIRIFYYFCEKKTSRL